MLNYACDNVPFCLFANYIIGHYHFFLIIPQSFYKIAGMSVCSLWLRKQDDFVLRFVPSH